MNNYRYEDLWFEVKQGDLNIHCDGETLSITIYPVNEEGLTMTAKPRWSMSVPLAKLGWQA